MNAEKPRLLFLCTGNSCRSQMAEGWARHLKSDQFDIESAGVEAHGLNPRAVKVMAEASVPIDAQESKTVDALAGRPFDVVISVCDSAASRCPTWPGAPLQVRHCFDDPAGASGTEEEILAMFRRVRDEIRDYVRGLPSDLAGFSSQVS